jgi:hypothetical protein
MSLNSHPMLHPFPQFSKELKPDRYHSILNYINAVSKNENPSSHLDQPEPENILEAFALTIHEPISDILLTQIAEETGFSKPMIRERFIWLKELSVPDQRNAWLQQYYEVVPKMEGENPRYYPRWLGIIGAGTIPGTAFVSIINGLLHGFRVIIKPSSKDTLFLYHLLKRLISQLPILASRIVYMPFSSTQLDITAAFLECCERLIVYGSDETIQWYTSQYDGNILPYGHKISAGICGVDAFNSAAILQGMAWDICLFDRSGCLSPQVYWCSTQDLTQLQTWATQLATYLFQFRDALPPGDFTPEQYGLIRTYLGGLQLRDDIHIIAPDNLVKEAIIISENTFRPLPEGRLVMFRPFTDIEDVILEMKNWGPVWQGLSVAGCTIQEIARIQQATGISYICEPGRMQYPPATWENCGLSEHRFLHHDLTNSHL